MEAYVNPNQNQNPNPNVMGQSVNPETYNEHQPGLQPSTPQHPNPENEPSVFGPFGSTEWIDRLADTFKNGQVSSIRSANGQLQIQGNQGGQGGQQGAQSNSLQGQLGNALQALFQRDDITCIRQTPEGQFQIDTKDGRVYQSNSLRSALQQIPNLDLSQPFGMKGQQGSSQQTGGGPTTGMSGQGQRGASGTSSGSMSGNVPGNAPGNIPGSKRPSGQS